MTALAVVIILAVVLVLIQIGRITVAAAQQWWHDEERAAGWLVDQPTTEEVGQPMIGVRSSDANGS